MLKIKPTEDNFMNKSNFESTWEGCYLTVKVIHQRLDPDQLGGQKGNSVFIYFIFFLFYICLKKNKYEGLAQRRKIL